MSGDSLRVHPAMFGAAGDSYAQAADDLRAALTLVVAALGCCEGMEGTDESGQLLKRSLWPRVNVLTDSGRRAAAELKATGVWLAAKEPAYRHGDATSALFFAGVAEAVKQNLTSEGFVPAGSSPPALDLRW
jgi:hypothetical protein